ncbi:MAG: alpha/beta fold hydrolase [Gemmatimonadaceae bacterium]
MRGEFVDIGGRRLYYYAAGSRGAGDPVVFLHGFPTSSRLWHAVVRDFPAGHRLVVLDLPGYGRSDPLPREGGSAGCGAHARAVLSLLDELRIARACLVGHGLGGGVAQAVAVQWPERVSALALVGSAGFGIPPRRMARVARAIGPLARRAPPGLLASLVHGGVRRGFADTDRSHLTLDTCLHAFTTRAGRDALARHLAALGECGTAEWSARLGELRIPAAVIWGHDDPFYPVAQGARLAAAIPGATFEVIAGAAHFVPEDSPDQLRRSLDALLARLA